MATYNSAASDVLSSSLAAAAAAEHFERSAAAAAAAAATFIVPATSLESFVAASPHFVSSSPHPHPHQHHHQQQQQQHHHQLQQHHHQQTNSSSSYTFLQIKREPCQVSEVTTSNNNCHQQQQQQHHQQQHHQQQQQQSQLTTTNHGLGLGCHSSSSSTSASLSSSSSLSSASKTMSSSSSSSSTLTTLVKIEASSPKVHELDKAAAVATLAAAAANVSASGGGPSTNNSVPIGIAVARKRPQESSVVGSAASLCNPSAMMPTTVQQSLNKDMNCFGIRVADLGGVGNGCGNIYFTGNGDLMTTGSATSEELALSATGVQSVNRAPSTYWQYPNALPIESVISMSPATVGLQYSREASRGQVVLLPATAAALGISNFPLYTPTDPFQQAAAAFVWPSYIPQGSAPAAATASMQPPPNFIFPSAAGHSTLQPQSYATSLQLFGSNYLTAAAAAAAATAAAATTLCQQHNQQQQQTSSSSSSTSSINLSLNGGASSSSTSSRFLSMTSIGAGDKQPKHLLAPPVPLPLPPPPLLLPPTAMKIEDWSGAADFMAAAAKTTTSMAAAQMITPPTPLQQQHPPPLSYELRGGGQDKTHTTNHHHHQQQHHQLLDLQNGGSNNPQALNLMRMPTPPSSATIENASVAAAAANADNATSQLQTQLLFQTTSGTTATTASNSSTTHTPTLLNLSASLTRAPQPTNHNPPPTTHFLTNSGGDDASASALNFKTSTSFESSSPGQYVVGVPRSVSNATVNQHPPPQMQDVNIQTDTPVCSEDENSSCPIAIQQQQNQLAPQATQPHETYSTASDSCADDAQQPLELIKTSENNCEQLVQPPPQHTEPNNTNNQPYHNILESAAEASSAIGNDVAGRMQQMATPELHQQIANSPPPLHVNRDLNVIITAAEQSAPEDLTGLELLSNISTSTLAAKNSLTAVQGSGGGVGSLMRVVKQEPLEHSELTQQHSLINAANANCTTSLLPSQMCGGSIYQSQPSSLLPPPPAVVEPLGGLNLLCALAEQRIQEEVQCNGSLFGAAASTPPLASSTPSPLSPPPQSSSTFTFQQQAVFHHHHQQLQRLEPSSAATFPSMEGIELPSNASGVLAVGSGEPTSVIKRKKHKHSKSNRSASATNVKKSSSSSSTCAKKNKKKYSKEKRKNRLAAAQLSSPTAVAGGGGGGSDELDFDDEQLQAELKNAFSCVDPTQQRYGKWPNPEEIFSIMESNMRMRLADINRQYRKKKRKLDEISKNKKKKKCSKLAAAAAQQHATAQLLATSALSSVVAGAATTTSSSTSGGGSLPTPLCDYKFAKFSSQSNTVSGATYLNPSSAFLRFADAKTASSSLLNAPQFPPPAAAVNDASSLGHVDEDCTNTTNNLITSYKPVRLEPSSLAANAESRNGSSSSQRHAQKHALTERSRNGGEAKKERKLSRPTSDDDAEETTPPASAMRDQQQEQNQTPPMRPKSPTPMDRELTLTSEHLYRKETRVLTDMGGLFYAGIMKPLQPPDVYAITLDGERGNKSHIMSREEIFKDTILEVAPKSVNCVPIGTRLCAYWSQQYRCLYPGRAIESETSDDGGAGAGSTTSAAAAAHDFVSVEFDDGDSGRIRLQNIRLLLSDYPIVEYNDNPLYSLGKQKKSSVKSGNTSDPHQHDQSSSAAEDNHRHHLRLATQATSNSRGVSSIGTGCGSGAVTSEMHPSITRELYAQRSEKKRIKNLKKKTQAAAAAAAATKANGVAGAGCGGVSNASTGGDIDDGSRKHHKHKKRKKHKKHHHRKGGIGNSTFIINTAAAGAPASYVSKLELPIEEKHNAAEEEEDEEEEEQQQHEMDTADEREQSSHDSRESNLTHKAATALIVAAPPPIKLEMTASLTAASSGSIKVKTEHLDLEEETTSNLMSEVSDEVKCDDEVEHNNSKGSKIAAFLPDRQLWGWQGKAYRKAGVKGRARKQFFKSIKRGKETITVGDCAVFLSTGRPDRPYIGRIESMWETTSSNKVVRVRWFYHPEETTGCPNLKYPGALFESPHEDENDVQTISHRCEVLQFLRYFGKFGADSKQYQSIYDNNDTYYLAGYYNPRLQVLKLQDDIPTLEEQNNTTDV